jgi:hypothetical protein
LFTFSEYILESSSDSVKRGSLTRLMKIARTLLFLFGIIKKYLVMKGVQKLGCSKSFIKKLQTSLIQLNTAYIEIIDAIDKNGNFTYAEGLMKFFKIR